MRQDLPPDSSVASRTYAEIASDEILIKAALPPSVTGPTQAVSAVAFCTEPSQYSKEVKAVPKLKASDQAPLIKEKIQERAVTPLYGIDAKLSADQLKRLLSIAGDHSVAEHEWVRACHLLGDYDHGSAIRKRKKQQLYLTLALLFAVGAGTIWFVGNLLLTTTNFAEPKPLLPAEVSQPAAPNFRPYMANLQRRIKRAWYPPKADESKRVVVIFNVTRDGALSKLRISTSSGSEAADAAALQAVENAAPFRPLPPGADKDVDIQFTFDYNVFTSSGSRLNPGHSQAQNGDYFSTQSSFNGGEDAFSSGYKKF
jgi:TonB family protein